MGSKGKDNLKEGNSGMRKRKHQVQQDPREEKQFEKNKSRQRLPEKSWMLKMWPLLRSLAVIIIVVAFVALSWQSNILRSIPFFHKCELPLIYSVIFDAGSTGSRVHVFSFYNDSGNLLLAKEIFEEVKPGLSSYADKPKDAANSLIPLLEIAKNNIPEENWASTPTVLYATAGLRLLPGDQSKSILNEVTILLMNYPFLLPKNAVSIMSGKDEAIFGWVTINYLLGRLQEMKNTVALMDLGGGSTQITFLASDADTMTSRAHDLKVISLYRHNITLYAKSYLGNGLMEARLNILGGTKDDHKLVKDNDSELLLKSPCIVDGMSEKWKYNGITYNVQSHNEPVNRSFESCFILTIPLSYAIFKPKELKNMELYGISYFNDRASDAGLIDLMEGGTIQVVKFYNKAKEYCANKHEGSSLLCLDLTYITALLWKGYDIDGLREINLYKKINDVETSWCLGAAYMELVNSNTKS